MLPKLRKAPIHEGTMATAINDITGNQLKTMPSKKYSDNYDAIFRKDLNNHLLHDPVDGFEETNDLLETKIARQKELIEKRLEGRGLKDLYAVQFGAPHLQEPCKQCGELKCECAK